MTGQIINDGDFVLIAIVTTLEDTVNKSIIDVSEQLFNRLVLDLGVLDRNRSLENADTLRVLVDDSLDIFGCPERVLKIPCSINIMECYNF